MSGDRVLRGVVATDLAALTSLLEAALSGTGDALTPLAPEQPAHPARVPDAVDIVIATSGSSGIPKLVAHSGAALRAGAEATAQALGGHGQWLLALPSHYVAGLQVLVRSIIAGTRPVVLAPGHFDPAALTLAAATMAPGRRYTALVPAQLIRVLDDPGARDALASFDAVLVGGQAVPVAVAERAEAAGITLVRTYGSSETGGGAVYNGHALPGVRVREHGGELQIAAPQLALGYLGDDGGWDRARTAAAFLDDGADGTRWYRTGDAGTVTGGRVAVTGRRDNVLISGGTNVSLDRVEAQVRELPGLAEAVVVAAPDERWGQVPVVVVAGESSRVEQTLADLRRVIAAALGPAAQPDRILVVAQLPRLTSGKPDRRAITALASDGAR